MIFDEVSVNQFVRFTEALEYGWRGLRDDVMWSEEPLDCVLTVLNVRKDNKDESGEDDEIEVECVVGCGQHQLHTIKRQDYEHVSEELNHELLVEATSMAEFGELLSLGGDFGGDEEEFDLDKDTLMIYDLIREDKLPVFRGAG